MLYLSRCVWSFSFAFLINSLRTRNGKMAMRDIVQFVRYIDYQHMSKDDIQIVFCLELYFLDLTAESVYVSSSTRTLFHSSSWFIVVKANLGISLRCSNLFEQKKCNSKVLVKSLLLPLSWQKFTYSKVAIEMFKVNNNGTRMRHYRRSAVVIVWFEYILHLF